jgi:hypothetical protein
MPDAMKMEWLLMEIASSCINLPLAAADTEMVAIMQTLLRR